ncbi:Ig domain-containing protein group 2 domain-containing protein [Thermincola ferriacetica]|uniref:Ig domain-containing protein group 2 domain-containing protein n=1 Tax=Thermincola ferriacetica TaxID=281456 RepID=A0A0L6W4Z0_9FIRM|nr:FlgD immunoglobulin-like domain containing protein [Thermincola ferriacetica]KNZ70536.1 Ig domain-containing protein group 2 domain-containing protein [Thermincola ferriacetica]
MLQQLRSYWFCICLAIIFLSVFSVCNLRLAEAGTGKIIARIVDISSSQISGQTVNLVKIDEKNLLDRLNQDQVASNVLIPINNTSSTITVQLASETLRALAGRNIKIEVAALHSTYLLPASEIPVAALAKELAVPENLFCINIIIGKVDAEQEGYIRTFTEENMLRQVVKPVEFKVEAVAGERSVEIKKFKSFITRTMTVETPIDINRTTGAALTGQGRLIPVPTQFTEDSNGRVTAIIKHQANGVYTVIDNEKNFEDTLLHWGQDEISLLASKMVIAGVNNNSFAPDSKITRAQFTAMLTRALGLEPKLAAKTFRDIRASDWYAGTVGAAAEAGIIKGYKDGTFKPNVFVTREQAVIMLSSTLDMLNKKNTVTLTETAGLLAPFKDKSTVRPWVKQLTAIAIKSHIITGNSEGLLSLEKPCTRAEAVVMITRMLRKAELITSAFQVDSPIDNFKTNKNYVFVFGKAQAGSSVTVNNKPVYLKPTGSFVSDAVYLSPGNNTITVTATDQKGNRASLQRTVIYDKYAPDFDVIAPVDNLLTNKSPLAVAGYAEPGCIVKVNGRVAKTDNQGNFRSLINLNPGKNLLAVSVIDNAGNAQTCSRTVVYDHTPPELFVTSPTEETETGNDMVIVTGYAEPESTVNVNWSEVPLDSERNFSKVVDLAVYSNRLFITARDKAGNMATIIRRVIYNDNRVTGLTLPDRIRIGAGISISYKLTVDGCVTVKIYNANGYCIRTLARDVFKTAGLQFLVWDGKDEDGNLVADGKYKLVVEARDKEGKLIGKAEKVQVAARVPIITEVSDGQELFNPLNGGRTSQFELSCDALITVTILKNYAPVVTLIADSLKSAGKNTVYWDGKDSSGNLVEDGTYVYQIEAVNPIEPSFKTTVRRNIVVEKGPPVIKDFTVGPDPLPIGVWLNIIYTLSEDADVTLKILDNKNNVIKVFDNDAARRAGPNSAWWDGKGSNGKYVSAGNYTVEITAVDKYGKVSESKKTFSVQNGGVKR